jgi:5-methylthioadenosine/S-adenosylhomocysteine deaminase
MSGQPVDPLDGPRWAVAGRVVTMDDINTVIDAGVVYIDKGVIVAVHRAADAAPAGFESVTPLQSNSTLFPGLIELHNHLCFNALPMWKVPRPFTNRDTWQNNSDYKEAVGKPMTLIGSTPQLMAALVRYVEVKSLVAGVTASQGITLSKYKGGAQAFFKGNVRNVEQTGEAALPAAHTHIGDIAAEKAAAALAEQDRVKCYLQHLCEGTDAKARQHFLDLALPNNKWAIAESFTGIHSLALEKSDLSVIDKAGAKIVWSPTSNFLLYGNTAKIKEARDLGIFIGLGSDWAPSGSKNLLWELKVARAFSAENGGFLQDIDLVAMVTRDAARVVGWEKLLGTLKANMRADLMAIDKATGDCAPQLFAPRQIQLISRSSIRRRSAPSNIHDAVHPAPISRAQRHPPPVDGGIPASGPSPICPADQGLPDPGCCAV